jgi:parallel beta helix pectate lyase-like protein
MARISKASLAALLALCVTGAEATAAQAARLRCGDTVRASIVLHADLTDCSTHGLRVGADGVTINLNGHTIAGDGVPSGSDAPDVGVLSEGFDQVTVENGTVRRFDLGVLVSDGSRDTISGLTVRQSGDFPQILALGTTAARVAGNDTSGSGVSGITLLFADHSAAAHNHSANNPGTGICDCGGHYNSIAQNFIAGSADNGILVGFGAAHALVARNSVTGSAAAGVSFDDVSDSVARLNVVRRNADGIDMGGNDNRIEHTS